MTRNDDTRLEGRAPEFARMSLKPGIGADAMHDVASVLLYLEEFSPSGDVPRHLTHGEKDFPLSRYLRRKLRTYVGKAEACPPEVLEQIAQELSPMWDAAAVLPALAGIRQTAFKNALIDADNQRVANMLSRQSIFKTGGKI